MSRRLSHNIWRWVYSLIVISLSLDQNVAKIYERCELARELCNRKLPLNEVALLTSIASQASGLDSDAYRKMEDDVHGVHGLFQIDEAIWCSTTSAGGGCNMHCDRLHDEDITDSVKCVRMIFAVGQQLHGNGCAEWGFDCETNKTEYIRGCFPDPEERKILPCFTVKEVTGANMLHATDKNKMFTQCELALELFYRHNYPMHEIATWVCIARHGADYNTSAFGVLNPYGGNDHGIFQISDHHWCSNDGNLEGKMCGIPCENLRNFDIYDDAKCVRHIYHKQALLNGDGFTAWAVYDQFCRNQTYLNIASCFRSNRMKGNNVIHPMLAALPATSGKSETDKLKDQLEVQDKQSKKKETGKQQDSEEQKSGEAKQHEAAHDQSGEQEQDQTGEQQDSGKQKTGTQEDSEEPKRSEEQQHEVKQKQSEEQEAGEQQGSEKNQPSEEHKSAGRKHQQPKKVGKQKQRHYTKAKMNKKRLEKKHTRPRRKASRETIRVLGTSRSQRNAKRSDN